MLAERVALICQRGMIHWLMVVIMLLACASPAHAEQRLALVIANEAYVSPNLGRLPGTRMDTARMQTALNTAGFTVRVVSNAQKAQMQRAVADFVRDLAKAGQDGVGFLYYTGHGIADAKRGANYLIPVEADITSAAELPLYALPMDDVLDAIEGAGARAAFVVFDACRSTPTSLSRGGKGLLPSRGRTDTLVAFATAPGETAADDGLYSRVLADHLARAGANSTTLFAEVQAEVARSSGRRQVPQFLSSLVEPVQFVAGGGGTYGTPPGNPTYLGPRGGTSLTTVQNSTPSRMPGRTEAPLPRQATESVQSGPAAALCQSRMISISHPTIYGITGTKWYSGISGNETVRLSSCDSGTGQFATFFPYDAGSLPDTTGTVSARRIAFDFGYALQGGYRIRCSVMGTATEPGRYQGTISCGGRKSPMTPQQAVIEF